MLKQRLARDAIVKRVELLSAQKEEQLQDLEQLEMKRFIIAASTRYCLNHDYGKLTEIILMMQH